MKRVLILAMLTVPLCAQWLKYPTPGVPRLPDGKPNMAAPAPKTAGGKPDLSGIWHIDGLGYATNITSDLKPADILPSAQALYQQRLSNFGKDAPVAKCLPMGPAIGLFGELQKIIQTPEEVAILNENGIFRQIFMDGRPLPEDPTPAWQGYSVGHWDGDTLVVETAGFKDKSWLDLGGFPHSEALRLTQRYRRVAFGRMQLQMTFDDPKVFTRQWSITMDVFLVPDTELLEFVCNENERDSEHLIGRRTDELKGDVKVPAAVLAKYVGKYLTTEPPPLNIGIALSESGALMMDVSGRGAAALMPVSPTKFFNSGIGGEIEFFTDAQGKVTHLVLSVVEGDFKAEHK